MTTIFGWIAGSISVSCAIPQIYYTYKLKSVSSISLYSLLFKTISGILYIIHGYNTGDTAGYCITSASRFAIFLIPRFKFSESTIKNFAAFKDFFAKKW